jgi:hypothetical protein
MANAVSSATVITPGQNQLLIVCIYSILSRLTRNHVCPLFMAISTQRCVRLPQTLFSAGFLAKENPAACAAGSKSTNPLKD